MPLLRGLHFENHKPRTGMAYSGSGFQVSRAQQKYHPAEKTVVKTITSFTFPPVASPFHPWLLRWPGNNYEGARDSRGAGVLPSVQAALLSLMQSLYLRPPGLQVTSPAARCVSI